MSMAIVFAAVVWIACVKEEQAVVGNSLAPPADECCNDVSMWSLGCLDCRIRERKIAAAVAAAAEDVAHSRTYSQDAAAVAKAWTKTMAFDRRAALFAHPDHHHLDLDLVVAAKKKAGAADESDTWNAAVPSALGWVALYQLQYH